MGEPSSLTATKPGVGVSLAEGQALGRTFQAIADGLMADGIPTARGKTRWCPATIKAVVTSDNAAALA